MKAFLAALCVAALAGCGGSDHTAEEPPVVSDMRPASFDVPGDLDCLEVKRLSAVHYGMPDRVDQVAGAETWWYLSEEYARVFDWGSGLCVVTDYWHAHPRPEEESREESI